jgi:hypothetical protein
MENRRLWEKSLEHFEMAENCKKFGRWKKAKKYYKKARKFYILLRSHNNSEYFNLYILECDKNINRLEYYLDTYKSSEQEKNILEEGYECVTQSKEKIECETISDTILDDIMISYHNMKNFKFVTDLGESFFLIPAENIISAKERIANLELELENKNILLQNLKEENFNNFKSVKKSMEQLSGKARFLFPDNLISRYNILLSHLKYIEENLCDRCKILYSN